MIEYNLYYLWNLSLSGSPPPTVATPSPWVLWCSQGLGPLQVHIITDDIDGVAAWFLSTPGQRMLAVPSYDGYDDLDGGEAVSRVSRRNLQDFDSG